MVFNDLPVVSLVILGAVPHTWEGFAFETNILTYNNLGLSTNIFVVEFSALDA